MSKKIYDVVIVGAGIAGALVANEMAKAGKTVLILEAGTGLGLEKNGYKKFSERYFKEHIKVPNSPYKHSVNAPAPAVTDIFSEDESHYFKFNGPTKYGSNYTRIAGGTTLHWLGTCLRMLPNDFKMKEIYGVGVDWPISYWDLKPYYEKAEWEIGVSADRQEQEFLLGNKIFGDTYEYPMSKIPNSYVDNVLGKHIDGMAVLMSGETHTIKVTGTPAGRNSVPNEAFDPRQPDKGKTLYRPVGSPDNLDEEGQRCQGNSSCVPVCPIHAKYTALKTLSAAIKAPTGTVDIITQAVVTNVYCDSEIGKITKVGYKHYSNPDRPWSSDMDSIEYAEGHLFVLAANAIENAKLLLASNIGNSSGLVGRFLMDHPFILTWGFMPENVGSYRGPGSTAGIPQFRDGKFRKNHAAFRVEIGNLGWTWPKLAPYSSLEDQLSSGNNGLFGMKLRNKLSENAKKSFRFGFGLEQLPDINNCVTINKKFLDDSGSFKPIINYSISDYTRNGMLEATRVSKQIFKKINGAIDMTKHQDCEKKEGLDEIKDPRCIEIGGEHILFHGAGHAAGTHRMGRTSDDSVVNSFQQSWDHENLFIVGCGSFCTVGTSNPTLTLGAITLRTCERMIEILNR